MRCAERHRAVGPEEISNRQYTRNPDGPRGPRHGRGIGAARAESSESMTQSPYPDAPTPGQNPQDAPTYPGVPPYQVIPQAPPVPAAYGYGTQQPQVAPQGMYFEPNSGLTLPNGVQLAGVGRRVGAYFLSIILAIVTLGIGYLIWGLIAWGKGTSPAFQVLGLRCWRPAENRVATWGTMALRNIVGYIAQGILSFITLLVSFILFLSGKKHQSIPDLIGGTVVVHDPNKILDTWVRH